MMNTPPPRASGTGPAAADRCSAARPVRAKVTVSAQGPAAWECLKDPEFVLYYQKVQQRIKRAWSFYGGNKNLTTSVEFAIGPDGKITSVAIKQSSNNAAFDQSVLRAVRLAAPFPPARTISQPIRRRDSGRV